MEELTETQQRERIEEWFGAMLDAFNENANRIRGTPGSPLEKFEAATRLRDAMRSIKNDFSIASGDYDHCVSGTCSGGACTRQLSFAADGATTQKLRELAIDVGVTTDKFTIK